MTLASYLTFGQAAAVILIPTAVTFGALLLVCWWKS